MIIDKMQTAAISLNRLILYGKSIHINNQGSEIYIGISMIQWQLLIVRLYKT